MVNYIAHAANADININHEKQNNSLLVYFTRLQLNSLRLHFCHIDVGTRVIVTF